MRIILITKNLFLCGLFSASTFAFETQQSIDLPDCENTNFQFVGSNSGVPAEVNNHPQSGWLEECPLQIPLSGEGEFFKGNVSAIGTLFMDPSPIEDPAVCGEARVFMKTITTQFAEKLHGIVKQDEESDLDLSARELRRAIRKVGLQFLLLSLLEARTFVDDGIDLSVNFLGENRILESDNLDDEEDDIKYTVKAEFKNIRIKNLLIMGKLFPEKDENGIPTWHLTLMVEEIGTCADVDATGDLTNREKDGSYLDFIPVGTASASGEACLTVKNAEVPIDVTIVGDEDDEDGIVSKFTVIPPEREHELDEGTKKLKVQLKDLTVYDYVVSQLILELLEPAVEDLLYEELNIDELLSEAAEEVLEVPLSFGEK